MPSLSPRYRRWRTCLSGALVLIVIGATTILGLSLLAQHKVSRAQEVTRVVEVLKGFAGGMAETADRSLSAIDIVLAEMNGALYILRDNGDHWPDWNPDRGHQFLASRTAGSGLPQVRHLILFDRDGWQLFHSIFNPAPRFTVKDRPYFKALLAGAAHTTWGPYIGRNSGTYTFAIAHRLEDRAGVFSGVLFAGIEPSYFRGVCDQLRPGPTMSGLFVNSEGHIIAACNGFGQINMTATSVIGRDALDVTQTVPTFEALEAAGTIVLRRDLIGHPGISAIVAANTAPLLDDWHNLEAKYLGLTIGSIAALILAGFGVAAFLSHGAQRERELRSINERLKAADAAKSRFLATMSHELRTPLNSIISFTEFVETQAFGPVGDQQYLEYAEYAGAGARHLLALINGILEFSKIEAGTMRIHPVGLPVVSIVTSAVQMLQHMALAAGVTIEVKLPPAIPDLWVDERAMRQILINLLGNAIKFNAKGGSIVLTARDAGLFVDFVITDTGSGIPGDEIARILKPFEQLDNKYSRSKDGTGLGLTIVDGLVKLHGGALTIESALGQGTTVTVRLPSVNNPACSLERVPSSAGAAPC